MHNKERLTQNRRYTHRQDSEVTALGSAGAASRVSKLAETQLPKLAHQLESRSRRHLLTHEDCQLWHQVKHMLERDDAPFFRKTLLR